MIPSLNTQSPISPSFSIFPPKRSDTFTYNLQSDTSEWSLKWYFHLSLQCLLLKQTQSDTWSYTDKVIPCTKWYFAMWYKVIPSWVSNEVILSQKSPHSLQSDSSYLFIAKVLISFIYLQFHLKPNAERYSLPLSLWSDTIMYEVIPYAVITKWYFPTFLYILCWKAAIYLMPNCYLCYHSFFTLVLVARMTILIIDHWNKPSFHNNQCSIIKLSDTIYYPWSDTIIPNKVIPCEL